MTASWYVIPSVKHGDVTILESEINDWNVIEKCLGELQFLYLSFERNEFIAALARNLLTESERTELLKIFRRAQPERVAEPLQLPLFQPAQAGTEKKG